MSTPLSILAVPAFDDNYLWIVHNGKHAVVVDPGDGERIEQVLLEHDLQLSAILLTHHHRDHCGGVAHLLNICEVPVYGPELEQIDGVNNPLAGGETLHLPSLALRLDVIAVPGHTRAHLAYYNKAQSLLFCGDTLFAGGCGRLFEGSAEQMLQSLMTLAKLPEQTKVYCAHEYTLSNLRFAIEVEPDNLALQQRYSETQALRAKNIATVPSTIALEKCTNPFLRCDSPTIRERLQRERGLAADADRVAYFAELRQWKNNYR